MKSIKQFVKEKFNDAQKNELGWAKEINRENFDPHSFEVVMTSRWRAKKMSILNILDFIETREQKSK